MTEKAINTSHIIYYYIKLPHHIIINFFNTKPTSKASVKFAMSVFFMCQQEAVLFVSHEFYRPLENSQKPYRLDECQNRYCRFQNDDIRILNHLSPQILQSEIK